jgi:NitT/TauT family transport system substrate-binding protein
VLLAGLLAAVLLVGCGGDDDDGAAASAAGKEPETRTVSVRLNVLPTTYHAGFYVAQDMGFYADEGLEVKLEGGTGSTQAAQLVAAGKDDFGFTSADGTLRVADAGGKLKMIGNVLPEAGFCLMVPADSGIDEPKDLEGRSVGDAAGFITLQLLPALWDAAGVDPDKVKIINVDPADRYRSWAAGAYEGMSSIFVEPIAAKVVEGIDNKCFRFSDYGVNLLGYGIVANAKTLEDPDLVRRFLRATLKGFNASYDDPQKAAETILRLGPESVTEQRGIEKMAEPILEEMASLWESAAPEGEPFGYMPDELWADHAKVMQEFADLGDDFELADYYTNEYLEGAE